MCVLLKCPLKVTHVTIILIIKNPKTKKIKKVSFGDTTGLSVKLNNPKARKAFAARHNCKDKKDRTKAGYWSCNLPRYAKQLGLGANMNTFW